MKQHRLNIGGALTLYGDVGDLWGDGSGFTARDVQEALLDFEGDIVVRLNSGGGAAFDGIAIYNAIKSYPGGVHMIVDGLAASAASIIAMAGDIIEMKTGSMMMIHDPAAMTMGNAETHEKVAGVLNQLGESAARIYAERTGQDAGEIRALMLAETWMDDAAAMSLGFADAAAEAESVEATATAPAFDFSMYKAVPASVHEQFRQRDLPKGDVEQQKKPTSKAKRVDVRQDIAVATATMKGEEMPEVIAAVTKPETAKKDNTLAIMQRCKAAKLTLEKAEEIILASSGDMETAIDLIFAALDHKDPAPAQSTLPTASTSIVADERDRFVEGATKGIMARAGLAGGERNEFSGETLRGIARMSLDKMGIRSGQFTDPMTMIGAAFNPRMAGGMHSTSDFANVLADVANKSMLTGYEEASETFPLFTSTGSLADFKTHNRIDIGLFPALEEVPEGAEYHSATVSDRKSTISLATYGRMFAITRQAIINDDMSVFTRVPMKMGMASKRTIGNLVWALITSNPTMADGTALFHADHGNLAGSAGAPTVSTVDAGRVAMGLQTDPDNIAHALNLRPAYFLVPYELEGTARVLMSSEFDPAKTQRSPNSVAGIAQVISEARLSTNSATAWYLAASPSAVDTIEVAYLNGNQSPVLEQREGWNVDGIEFKVRMDAGVQVHDHRGLYKNAG